MIPFGDIYRAKRVLITGHTGFKGSWLALWLSELKADITGVSLAPATTPNHWDLLDIPIDDQRGDIRDLKFIRRVIEETQPDIVFHLAAQPLVRRSYQDPIETWSTNVIGTANVLEACRYATNLRAVLTVTSDKCYENRESLVGYNESDALGGHDPYSASKAGVELVAASYRRAFFQTEGAPLIATGRAGNVIGGGDWSDDRLIPDLIRSLGQEESMEVRSPHATRPWQHVLESLSGYLLLGQELLSGKSSFAEAWNFGPDLEGNRSVIDVLNNMKQYWEMLRWNVTEKAQPHEATFLSLDSSKARSLLGWQAVWDLNTTLAHTARWYRSWLEEKEIISRMQLKKYTADATRANIRWARL